MDLFLRPFGNFISYLCSSQEYVFLTFTLLGVFLIIPPLDLNLYFFVFCCDNDWKSYVTYILVDIGLLLLMLFILYITGTVTIEQMINYFSGVRC